MVSAHGSSMVEPRQENRSRAKHLPCRAQGDTCSSGVQRTCKSFVTLRTICTCLAHCSPLIYIARRILCAPLLCDVQALQELSLADNQLQELPPSIAGLQSLARLWVYGNCLRRLPTELLQLPALKGEDLGRHERLSCSVQSELCKQSPLQSVPTSPVTAWSPFQANTM